MRRHRTAPGTPRSRFPQSDLFALPRVASGLAGTVWPALPEEARRSLTDLLARLFLEHEAGARRSGGRR